MKIQQVIDFVEDYSKPGFQAVWSFVVNVMRPFSAGMGLRVSHLSPGHVEIVVPNWLRNQDDKHLHEATFLTAAKEGQRLWLQRILGPETKFEPLSYHIRNLSSAEGEARVAFTFEDGEREVFLHQLQQKQNLEQNFLWLVRDEHEKACAEIEIKMQIYLPARIENVKKNKKKV